MHILEHLFLVGEFPERADLLSGLTLEQVTLRPDGASHSIYEELWHVAGYQRVLEPGDPAGDLPERGAGARAAMARLVRVFLDGARAGGRVGASAGAVDAEVEPGLTMADELNSVAVHNAYHLGRSSRCGRGSARGRLRCPSNDQRVGGPQMPSIPCEAAGYPPRSSRWKSVATFQE